MTTHETTTQGSCRCGQVQLTVHGRPLITMACHCTGCQRMTASAFSLSSLYPEGAVTVSGTEPVLGGLHGDTQHFCCPHCKSWVFTRAEMMGPFVNVRSTMLDDAASYVPFVDTMTSEKLPWVTTPAVHRFDTFPAMDQFGALMAEYASASR